MFIVKQKSNVLSYIFLEFQINSQVFFWIFRGFVWLFRMRALVTGGGGWGRDVRRVAWKLRVAVVTFLHYRNVVHPVCFACGAVNDVLLMRRFQCSNIVEQARPQHHSVKNMAKIKPWRAFGAKHEITRNNKKKQYSSTDQHYCVT